MNEPPRDDIRALMAGFDVLSCPLGERISNTTLEAMACGLAVVATDVGGNLELVTADTGILVPSADPTARLRRSRATPPNRPCAKPRAKLRARGSRQVSLSR